MFSGNDIFILRKLQQYIFYIINIVTKKMSVAIWNNHLLANLSDSY
jgi:hypothetical protein